MFLSLYSLVVPSCLVNTSVKALLVVMSKLLLRKEMSIRSCRPISLMIMERVPAVALLCLFFHVVHSAAW